MPVCCNCVMEHFVPESDDDLSLSFESHFHAKDFENEDVTVYAPASMPLPFGIEDKQDDFIFIDSGGDEARRILSDPECSIPELFALLRQPVTPVCDNLDKIVDEMLDRQVGPNDIDSVTGMNIIHYTVRAESFASDKMVPLRLLSKLLSRGGDVSQRTLFTDMNAVHLAAFFDASQSIEVMLGSLPEDEVRGLLGSACSEYVGGSPLHIAIKNSCVSAAEKLVLMGAAVQLRDDAGRTAASYVLDWSAPEDKNIASRLKAALSHSFASGRRSSQQVESEDNMKTAVASQGQMPAGSSVAVLKNQLSSGDRVLVAGRKLGIVRFMGDTKFSSGTWCGVELDDPVGRNDGSINGVRYFKCSVDRGIFAPPCKLTLVERGNFRKNLEKKQIEKPIKMSKKKQDNASTAKTAASCEVQDLKIGMMVYLKHLKEYGKIKYVGETDFASGIWVGLALQRPVGKNNGTVKGRSYFKCRSLYGTMVRPHCLSIVDCPVL